MRQSEEELEEEEEKLAWTRWKNLEGGSLAASGTAPQMGRVREEGVEEDRGWESKVKRYTPCQRFNYITRMSWCKEIQTVF